MREDEGLKEWAMHEALQDALSAKDDPEEFIRRLEAVPGMTEAGSLRDGGEHENFHEAIELLLDLTRKGNREAARFLREMASQNPGLGTLLSRRIDEPIRRHLTRLPASTTRTSG